MSDAPERIWAGNLRPLVLGSDLCIGEFVTYETGADGWNKYIRADLAGLPEGLSSRLSAAVAIVAQETAQTNWPYVEKLLNDILAWHEATKS